MMRLSSLTPPVLCDAIEQLFSGCSVENVATAVRKGLIGSGYSPDANLHQDLLSLQLLVRAHATANLAKIREEVLRSDISSVTKKRYEGVVAAEASPRSTTDEQTPKHVTVKGIILLALDEISYRLEKWMEIQHELARVCEGFIEDLNLLVKAIGQGCSLDEQENWLRLIDSQSSSAGKDKRQFNIELDVIVDACIRFAEARRFIAAALYQALDDLEICKSAEELNGVPSVAGRRVLGSIVTLGKDLRVLELNRAIWRLKNSGVKVPRNSVRAQRTCDIA